MSSTLLECFLKAWLIGLSIAAPIGPINMLCIRKTLEMGLTGTMAVGIGSACADTVYALIAAFGLTAITDCLMEKAVLIKFIGGIFLLYLAYGELKNKIVDLLPNPRNLNDLPEKEKVNLYKLATKVFFLTLTSPMTILSFIGIFASLGDGSNSSIESLTMAGGIVCGSITWSAFLGLVVNKIRHNLPESWLKNLRYISAISIGGFGIWAMLTSF